MKGNKSKTDNTKEFIDCRACSELPRDINSDTIIDVTNMMIDELDKANILVISKRKKLWIIGDSSRVYKNFTFLLKDDSCVVLDSFNLEGTQEHIPLIIEGNNCKISGKNRSSITVRNDLMAMQIVNNAKGTTITVEEENSVLQFCGVKITYSLEKQKLDNQQRTLISPSREDAQKALYTKVLPYMIDKINMR